MTTTIAPVDPAVRERQVAEKIFSELGAEATEEKIAQVMANVGQYDGVFVNEDPVWLASIAVLSRRLDSKLSPRRQAAAAAAKAAQAQAGGTPPAKKAAKRAAKKAAPKAA